jgi:hypothetical protein
MKEYEIVLRDKATGKTYRASDMNEIQLLEKGRNTDEGDVVFNNTKTARVNFDAPFAKKPRINLTLGDKGSAPAYRTDVSLTGMVVRFKSAWSGMLDWFAVERK